MGKYFGTDGFRGEAGITLTADHAYKVGRFLGWYYNALRERNGDTDPAHIVIGKDTRRSSYMFEYSLVAGLTASGADAYLLHVTTTPSVAYIARVDDFDCGIMISASHNPYYDNGIKLIDCYGEKMPEETLLLVEDYIDGKLHVFDKDWPELPFAHITSLEFVENIFRLMNWNRECRYKVLGRVANSDQGLCMLFDLEEAIMFTPKPQEYADPLTGEMKKKQMKFFPDTYRNRIGKSYNDYIADHQMNMFEDFIGYQGSAVLDEPVREEDSFSKESMSQESEISENILLPDLAKQSESIEQQSGEIAERGMPT